MLSYIDCLIIWYWLILYQVFQGQREVIEASRVKRENAKCGSPASEESHFANKLRKHYRII